MVHAAAASALPGPSGSDLAAVLDPAPDLGPLLRQGERPAAVLVPWIEGSGGPSLLFTVRAASLSRHAGEVSFPGGLQEAAESPLEAALRESHEEIGLEPSAVEVVGTLPPVRVPVSEALVLPFVGVLGGPPPLVLAEAEIAEAFTVPVAELVAVRRAGGRPGPQPGGPREHRQGWSFPVGDHVIWGATGAMLHALLERLRTTGPDIDIGTGEEGST